MSAAASSGSARIAFAIFLRLLGAIYLCAFVSLWVQIEGLVGERGIDPANELLAAASRVLHGVERFHRLPTLYWLHPSDGTLHALCGAGTALAAVATLAFAPAWIYALLWLLYLSLYSIGGVFLHFQWDILLLETGFLAILAAPLSWLPGRAVPAAPHWIVRGLLLWLLDRLMFASGAVKLLSGDPAWWGLEALTVHYETQPLPTWIGWWAHQLPHAVQVFSCAAMFAIELAVPPLIVIPGRTRLVAAALFALLQLLILATGNYCFFNLLTLALVVLLVDDRFWPARLRERALGGPGRGAWPLALAASLAVLLFVLSAAEFLPRFGVAERLFAPLASLRRALAPFELTNNYGLFAVMTTKRMEIAVEGSDDGESWREYRFRWKPGPLDARPRFVEPHQPRLDWQMWFAALGDVRDNPWFVRFVRRLLQGSPEVPRLLAENPFPERPPRFVRARLERYRFTTIAERRETGNWWQREDAGVYLRPVSLADLSERRDGMSRRFDGKIAVITGGASGIGAATARRLRSEGARLMLADLNEEGGRAIARELGGERDVAFRTLDVSVLAEVEALMEETTDRFGRIDVVFNNAGIGAYGKTPDLDPAVWHRVIEVDLHSVFYGCRAAIPHLRKTGGGAIVNTASISGLFADYGLAAYNAAKGAVVNFTRAVAIDHARENIRVNAVCPGAVETPLTAPMMSMGAIVAEYERLIPMGRVGRAEEIAATVAFLASDDASYVTGAAIVVDGGLTAATGAVNFTQLIGG